MPNIVAYVVLYTFPFVAFFLFRRLPLRLALIWVTFGGYMALPDRAGFDLPAIPKVDKHLIPGVMAAILCIATLTEASVRVRRLRARGPAQVRDRAMSQEGFLSARGQSVPDAATMMLGEENAIPRRSLWITALVLICLLSPILTMMTNREPLFYGPTWLRGLTIQDAWGDVQSALVMLVPFLLGRRYLATATSHRMILKAMCQMALVMSVGILIEVRLSPQLNSWIYGFQASSFAQHIRAGGYRPMLFLQHGLWVGVIISMSVVAAFVLVRSSTGRKRWIWAGIAVWLFFTLVISKTVGALGLGIILGTGVFLLPRRGQLMMAAALAGAVAVYPMLRSTGVVPVMDIYEMTASFSPERAQSLLFRIENEDQLLARANEKRLTGWGGWGRPAIFNSYTGERTSIADGQWVIAMGSSGWIGYLGVFGLLCLPIVMLAVRRRADLTLVTSGLVMVLAVNVVDLIPNATLTPVTWLLAGAVSGFYELRKNQTRAFSPATVPLRA